MDGPAPGDAEIDGTAPGDALEIQALNIFGAKAEKIIRKKFVFALCRNPEVLLNLHHFGDFSLKLMPCVLELVQEQYDYQFMEANEVEAERDALLRLFLTLKRWKMPLLFESVHRPTKVVSNKRKRNRRH